ncbi:MAG: hypothetical protein R2690_00485 [Acidimicrobiales bacterium]
MVRTGAAAVLAVALTMVVAPGPVAAADPSVTVGTKTLSADRTAPIDPAGDTITVRGTGYDPAKGIYVAICAIPAGGGVPTPCGGGEDRSGASGSSSWITNDPPSYASGLTAPYGPGGSFQVQLRVSANLPGGLDCRQIACAVTTRNDHTRSSDRSQDVLLPLTFAAVAAPTSAPPPTTAPATTTTTAPPTTTTTAPVDVARPAPSTRPTDDGAGVTDGTRTVQLDSGEPLPVDGRPVVITGRGFDPDKSLDVEVCAVPPTGEPPTACATSAIAAGPAKAAAHVVAPLDPAAAATPRRCRHARPGRSVRGDGVRPPRPRRSRRDRLPRRRRAPSSCATTTDAPPTVAGARRPHRLRRRHRRLDPTTPRRPTTRSPSPTPTSSPTPRARRPWPSCSADSCSPGRQPPVVVVARRRSTS